MDVTTATLLPVEVNTASASNECRMLMNVARYYNIISKIVDILDQCISQETVASLQVFHRPEAQSVSIYYGTIIEDCPAEVNNRTEALVKPEVLDPQVPSADDEVDLPAIIEDISEEVYGFEEQSTYGAEEVETEGMHVEELDLVEEEHTVDLEEEEEELQLDPEQDNDNDSNVSEYFIEYLQDEEQVAESSSNASFDRIEFQGERDDPELGRIESVNEDKSLLRYKCQFKQCNMKFFTAGQYNDHLQQEHADEVEAPMELQCKHIDCKTMFDDTHKLLIHYKTHKLQQMKAKVSLVCHICHVKFECKQELKQHLKEHPCKSNSGKMKLIIKRQCEFCEEILDPKIYVYNLHCLKEHGRALYNCFVCGKTFYLFAHLSEHIKTAHSAEAAQSFIEGSLWRTFSNDDVSINECRMCFRLFASQKAGIQHQEHHLKELSLTCTNCGGKHYESQCSDLRPKLGTVYEKVLCDLCQRWMSKKNIKEHLATHANERNYPCTVCKKTFKVQRTANRHIQNHINAQNKRRKCYDCDEVFDSEDSILEHYWQAHPDKRPYNCPICAEGFYLKVHLADHSHMHSDEDRRKISVKNPVEHYQIGNARVYECTLCRRCFSAKRTTVAHFLVHTDRPFLCEHCSMSFRTKASLEDHLLDAHKVKD
ncbi:zinc finger protein 197-like [Toxorhynchites rutilus septentrionalis]|uniref:zinc finger protein 197-like n=1 Tax=Toxorhynchites rutilus septentrionalis TaxID=329112 RepID=UPI0024787131|nr:zinc finger protein 197-like [Toxorhynchites rutilus septentrionalis]